MLDEFLIFEDGLKDLREISSWKYIRLRFYNRFYHKVPFEQRHNQLSTLKKVFKIRIFFRIRKTHYDKIVIAHPRINICQDRYFCKYTDKYVDDNTLVLGYDKRMSNSYENIISVGSIKILVYIFSVFFLIQALREVGRLYPIIYSNRNSSKKTIFLSQEILRLSISFSWEFMYGVLYRIFGIKEVYAAVAYGDDVYPSLVAAKNHEITFTEIQHGVLDYQHFGYSYCNYQINNKYYPQNMHVWSEYWKDKIRHKNIISFEITKPKYCHTSGIDRKKNRLLIIGQAHVQKTLLGIATKLNEVIINPLEIIYRPHPSELYKSSNPLVGLDENSLEISLQMTSYVLGVDSTVLIEAAHMNLNVLQLCLKNSYNYSKYENIKTFYNEKDVIQYFKNLS